MAIVCMVSLTGCRDSITKEKQEVTTMSDSMDFVRLTPAQYNAANITLGKISRKAIGSSLRVNGKLDLPPYDMVTIAAPMGGFVRSTALLPGMKIHKGSILVTLENQEYIQLQQDYLDNYSKLQFLEAEYNRQAELARENVNAVKSLQQSKSIFESCKAVLEGLEAKLIMINIDPSSVRAGRIKSTINLYAPMDGFVSQVNANVGQFINATDALSKIVNLDHIHAELQVYEKDINKIAVGQKVTFQTTNTHAKYMAEVYLIGKEINGDRTIGVHCHLNKQDTGLLPGMFITASIDTAVYETDVVPNEAIVNFQGQDYIFVSSGSRQFKAIPIATGNSVGQFTSVAFGNRIDRTTDVVLSGAGNLIGLLKNKPE